MKRIHTLLTIIGCLLCFIMQPSWGLGRPKDLSRGLPKGVRVYRYRENNAVFYLAEMERANPNLHFQPAVATGKVLGRDTVRRTAQRAVRNGTQVAVAVNASFGTLHGTYEGVIYNLHVQNGEIIRPPGNRTAGHGRAGNARACFGITKSGEFLMGDDVRMKAVLRLSGSNIPIYDINCERNRGTVLYAPCFGRSTRTRSGPELILTGLTVPITSKYRSSGVVASVNKGGNSIIPRDGCVISPLRGSKTSAILSRLKDGERAELEISFVPDTWNGIVAGIGGNYRLVSNGKIDPSILRDGRCRKKDPRTALGFNKEKLFLMVVDGRQGGYSNGLSMRDIAKVMIELGATEAINLDGGSSSTFVADGRVINRPSGGKERHILNSIFITSDSPSADSNWRVPRPPNFDNAPRNAIKVLVLSGNIYDFEYPVLKRFTSVGKRKVFYQQTSSNTLPGLQKAHILWVGQGEIREGTHTLDAAAERKIRQFVKNGGVVIASGQDSDRRQPCPTGWIPERIVGVDRLVRRDFQPTNDAGTLFSRPNIVRSGRVVIDDVWTDWSRKYTALATTNDGVDLVAGTLSYGKGMYIVTSFRNKKLEDVASNKAVMENLIYYAVTWLSEKL